MSGKERNETQGDDMADDVTGNRHRSKVLVRVALGLGAIATVVAIGGTMAYARSASEHNQSVEASATDIERQADALVPECTSDLQAGTVDYQAYDTALKGLESLEAQTVSQDLSYEDGSRARKDETVTRIEADEQAIRTTMAIALNKDVEAIDITQANVGGIDEDTLKGDVTAIAAAKTNVSTYGGDLVRGDTADKTLVTAGLFGTVGQTDKARMTTSTADEAKVASVAKEYGSYGISADTLAKECDTKTALCQAQIDADDKAAAEAAAEAEAAERARARASASRSSNASGSTSPSRTSGASDSSGSSMDVDGYTDSINSETIPHNGGFYLWQSVTHSDGCVSHYYCAHASTSAGAEVNSLSVGDTVTVAGQTFVVKDIFVKASSPAIYFSDIEGATCPDVGVDTAAFQVCYQGTAHYKFVVCYAV